MELNYRTAEGSQTEQPASVDESSEYVVRLRKNIKQIDKQDPASGEVVKMWSYDEAVLTREEYARKIADDNAAKIDYIVMMSDIDTAEVAE